MLTIHNNINTGILSGDAMMILAFRFLLIIFGVSGVAVFITRLAENLMELLIKLVLM